LGVAWFATKAAALGLFARMRAWRTRGIGWVFILLGARPALSEGRQRL